MNKKNLQTFCDFIRIQDSLEISDAGFSQKEIEELLNQIEINSQDALLMMIL